ncbi:hypothetical protein QUV83_07980 [Cellulomonas cellasea]|uniref:hypothetical protein n=1 Tax=Cellulomonas cellasea TaxID=43670 RepID=UPI0025A3C837|nr:hypothetical protein [Cellulomonas cellasea]MDM8084697.1 hypothetical protein [Cellulomonas cellasea]
MDAAAPPRDEALASSGAAPEVVKDRHDALVRKIALVPPMLVLLVTFAAWVAAVGRAGFWADDYVNLALYNQTLGDLSNVQRNDGKYTINVFWWWGTVMFGTGNPVPFVLTVSAVTVMGVWLWLRAGSQFAWGRVQAWWIAAGVAATVTPFGILLWASNIVHSVSILCLGLGLFAHVKAQEQEVSRSAVAWSALGACAWLIVIISNPLYMGFAILAGYLVLMQGRGWMARVAWPPSKIRFATGLGLLGHVGIPVLYFALVAYPMTTRRSSYSVFGFGEIRANAAFYTERLAPDNLTLVAYVLVVAAAVVASVARVRSNRLPLVLLATAAATALPVFMQGQQRADHYLMVPILLTLSALAAAVGRLPVRQGTRARRSVLVGSVAVGSVILAMMVGGSSATRSWWVTTPLGSALTQARQEIADRTPTGADLCVELAMDSSLQPGFVAAMGGQAGMKFDPIGAASAEYVGVGECDRATRTVVTITHDGNAYDAVVEGR